MGNDQRETSGKGYKCGDVISLKAYPNKEFEIVAVNSNSQPLNQHVGQWLYIAREFPSHMLSIQVEVKSLDEIV